VAAAPKGDGVHFVFLARIDETKISLNKAEIKNFRFIDLDQAKALMGPSLFCRLQKSFIALKENSICFSSGAEGTPARFLQRNDFYKRTT
jgi:hypothetical protein